MTRRIGVPLRIRTFVLLLTGALAVTPPTAVLAQEVASTPDATPAAAPMAPLRLSTEECTAIDAFHKEGQRRFADLQVALNEAGLGAGFTDPSTVDLEAAITRQVADQTRATLRQYADIDVPEIVQEFNNALVAFFTAFAAGLEKYADAVDAGADPDAALNALLAALAPLVAPDSHFGDLVRLLDACGLSFPDTGTARNLAALTDDTAQAQATATVPGVAREANNALLAFLDAFTAALLQYADRVDAGAAPLEVTNAIEPELQPFGIAVNELIQGLLERCGLSIGVDEADDGIPPLSKEECAEVFAWYEASAARFADLNTAVQELAFQLAEAYGIVLPGGLGSPNLSGEDDHHARGHRR
jgi:hypothetical protein